MPFFLYPPRNFPLDMTVWESYNMAILNGHILFRYEKGEREPVASVLTRMANYFGVSTDYLLGRTDKRD